MATLYPTAQDDATSIPNPTGVDTQDSPDHALLHSNTGDAVKAIEAKLGTGASTPVTSRLLFGTGTGTSAWTQLTSAQLAASLTDETGTGSTVFANSPTLTTPAVDTVNESTPANGVTIDGLNIKDSKLNTNNSVVTDNITDSAVTTAKINDSAVTVAKRIGGFKVGTFTISATGSKAITGVGFTPKFVQIINLAPTTATNSPAGQGGTDGTTQYATSTNGRDSASNHGARSSTSKCLLRVNLTGTVDTDASFTSFDSDGFTINVTTFVGSHGNDYAYVAYG